MRHSSAVNRTGPQSSGFGGTNLALGPLYIARTSPSVIGVLDEVVTSRIGWMAAAIDWGHSPGMGDGVRVVGAVTFKLSVDVDHAGRSLLLPVVVGSCILWST